LFTQERAIGQSSSWRRLILTTQGGPFLRLWDVSGIISFSGIGADRRYSIPAWPFPAA
jgi:hypothetical protein